MSVTLDGVKFINKPKKGILLLILLTLIEFVFSVLLMIALSANIWMPEKTEATAGIAKVLSYQGRLTDASGNPLGGSGTTYYFCFSIWDNPNVGSGNKLWPSGTPTPTSVTVTNGIFNAEIGSADNLKNFNFYSNDTIYLQVEVSETSGTCGQPPFETLNPRQRIAAVGYARATRDVYGDLLRTRNDANPQNVQIGTGAGASTPIYLSLDVKNNEPETIGSTGCSSVMGAGSIWYNSQNGRALICENNVLKAVGNASEIIGFKTNNATEAITSGTVVLAAGNNITLSQQTNANGGTITISAGAGGGGGGIGGIGAGTQTATSGTVIFSNSNNVTFGMQGQTITASAAPGQGIAGIAASNTTYTSGTVIISGGANITVGTDAGQKITISAAGQSEQTQNIIRGVVIGGNTAGATASITSGTMTLAGGNNITLSQNGNAITISAAGGGAAGSNTLGMSNLGNTSGTSGVISGSALQFILAGGNNITLSQSINGSSATITISAPAGATATGNLGGIAVSNSTTYTSGTVVLAAGPNITLSTNGQTISISGAAGGGGGGVTLSYFDPFGPGAERIGGQIGNASLWFMPLTVPVAVQADRVLLPLLVSLNTGSTNTVTLSHSLGFFTRNGNTLSLWSSCSGSVQATLSGIANSASYSGQRNWTYNCNITITPGVYWVGFWSRTSGGAVTLSNMIVSNINTVLSGYLGSASNISWQFYPGQGYYASTTTAMPSAVAFSSIQGSALGNLRPPIWALAYSTQ